MKLSKNVVEEQLKYNRESIDLIQKYLFSHKDIKLEDCIFKDINSNQNNRICKVKGIYVYAYDHNYQFEPTSKYTFIWVLNTLKEEIDIYENRLKEIENNITK